MNRPMRILLVEDSATDQLLAQAAFTAAGLDTRFVVVADGIEALAYLGNEGAYRDEPRPDLILLDLNLPRMSGHQLLERVKSSALHATIPVVILTTSSSERDVELAYLRHANCYVTKPVDFENLTLTAKSICEFWGQTARIPGMAKQST
jgi:two-component system, chemotaxis family, response regulator Rcp1